MKTIHSKTLRPWLTIFSLAIWLAACSTPEKVEMTDSQPATELHQAAQVTASPVEAGLLVQEEQKRREQQLKARTLRQKTYQAMSRAGRMIPTISSLELDDFYSTEVNRENYQHFQNSHIISVTENPVSTFSIDVDTAAYANVRRFLNQGRLPPGDAVRAEELINYFDYQYPQPKNREQAFSVTTEIAPTPWNKNSYLLRIGLQGYKNQNQQRPPANLVFLVDVSGSMHSRDKLPLLKSGLKLLIKQLREEDRISIVSYAGSVAVVLKPTPGNQHAQINMALDSLTSGGATNGAGGIQLAYQMAQQAFIEQGINRIILATDGDFNVGISDFQQLKQMVSEKRSSGISLSTLGFGQGNYNDHLMEQLADSANGNYSYIDNLKEARKVLVEEMGSTLQTIASDVKIQIEFNPQQVAEYRLIGYENRALQREDFNNDKVDAGEIGENHNVTALYEITLTDSPVRQLEKNRYTVAKVESQKPGYKNELAFLRLRYKPVGSEQSRLLEYPVYKKDIIDTLDQASADFRFAAAVAAFAQQLRGAKYLQNFSWSDILQLAEQSRARDSSGYRAEFTQLVKLAESLSKS